MSDELPLGVTGANDELRAGLFDFLVRLLGCVAGLSLGVGLRVASLNGLAEALRGRKLGDTAAREFVVDVKSRNALAQGPEVIGGAKVSKLLTAWQRYALLR